MNRSLHNNIRFIYLLGFFQGFMVVIPVFVPLLQGHGLSMSEVLQTQAAFALTIALCEVPSGYIADTWGRRRAIITGAAINASAFLMLLWAETFLDFLLFELLLGVGFSLLSGTDLALLYDTELHLQQDEDGRPQGPAKSLSLLIAVEAGASGIAGVVASLLLLFGSLESVLVIQAIAGAIPFLLGLALIEAPRPPRSGEHGENARHIVELLLFGKPVVLWTAFAITVFGLLAVYVFWVYQKYWELQGIPLDWFGYIWAAFALTVSLSARYCGVLERRLGTRALLALIAVLPLLGLLGMAIFGGWLGVVFGFAIQLSRGLSMSLFYEALNRRVPGDFRATVNSLVSLAVRAIFIVSGPILGLALDHFGMTSTLLALVVLFTPLMGVVLIPLVLRIKRESDESRSNAVSTA